VIFSQLAEIAGFVFAGRAGTLLHVTYVWLAVVVWAGAAALLATSVLILRVTHFVRARQ
jgi:hypothetical protein